MNRFTGLMRAFAFLFVFAGMIGFGAFSGLVSSYDTPASDIQADAIIILTGDAGRLEAGENLLQQGQAPKLLISGVHPSVTTADIRAQTNFSDAQFDCCVQLGHEAEDTAGNAVEAANWVHENGYQSLIIVTSDYHLPRSLLEMKAMMPNLEFIPYPVRTRPPWRNLAVARLWLQEYAKYATVWLGQKIITSAS